VTGGGSGIGRSASLLLAREGARVAVTDVSDNDGTQTVEEIKCAGGTGEPGSLFTKFVTLRENRDAVMQQLKHLQQISCGLHIAGGDNSGKER
jgi:NAD(P)-dependent dehydrogenase (short-subunit alcohol dehydrogenase family)